jgi:hypothetical protein
MIQWRIQPTYIIYIYEYSAENKILNINIGRHNDKRVDTVGSQPYS